MSSPIAIDPPGCGCTECLTGVYVALDWASSRQILDLLAGDIASNLHSGTEVVVTTAVLCAVPDLRYLEAPDSVTVRIGDLSWAFTGQEFTERMERGR